MTPMMMRLVKATLARTARVAVADCQRMTWTWLAQVAGRVNHEYAWAPQPSIPSCWPAHHP